MKHQAYCLYQKKTKKGYVWYVKFWNKREQRYSVVRSTRVLVVGKKGRYREAYNIAREILETLNYNPTQKTVIEYLSDFWQKDSPYFQERERLKKEPVSLGYIKKMQGMIKNHIAVYPEFQKLPIIELTAGNLKDWMLWLSSRGKSNLTIDKALLAIKVPVREAVSREELKHDPTKNVTQPTFTYQEKGVLKQQEVKELVEKLTDRDALVAVLLGVLCGMREGEVRGLRYEDIENGQIHIKNNFQDIEGGDKAPKCKSFRSVPLASILQDKIGNGTGYLFQHKNKEGKPRRAGYFRNLFINAMEKIGISEGEQKRRNLSFHSLRHTFITLGRLGGIPDPVIRALVGHKSASMTERYSHIGQVIDLTDIHKKFNMVIGLKRTLGAITEDNKRTIFTSKPYEGMRANL